MASAKVITNVTFTTGRVIKRNQDITRKAFTEVARQMRRKLKKAISRQGPPPSRSGNYPKKDKGNLYAKTDVTVGGRWGRSIKISCPLYGHYLDKGFTHYITGQEVKRPWITKLIFKDRKNWERKLNAALRKHAKKAK